MPRQRAVPAATSERVERSDVRRPSGITARRGWGIALIAILAAVAIHLGALDWYTAETIQTADGSTQRLPNTFASIDHPFHISKERQVLEAIRNFEFPRWIANHQGGYPVEFYPLGADLIVAAFWALGLGLVPLEVVHKLVVIAVLCIPAASYWAIARRDDLPASVAIVATLLHLFIPGSWMAGGPDELLRMGMWPNVAATYLTLPLLLFASDYLRTGRSRDLVFSVGVASLAIYTNPRSTIAIATVLLAVAIVTFLGSQQTSFIRTARIPALRLATFAGITVLLCSALLIPLRARQHEYEFLRFVEFDEASKFREYLGGAMPLEIVVLGLIGLAFAWRGKGYYSRIVALWFPLGLVVVLTAGWALRDLSFFAQLEGPRLIPMLRLPLLLLAAIAIHRIVGTLLARFRATQATSFGGVIAVVATAIVVLTPLSTLSADERGLPAIETTDQPAFTGIAASAEAFARITTAEDRALIIGSPLSDHASFWIPALSDANAFHAAWIWYWKTPDFADRTRIADINQALSVDFLRRHGLTNVLIATNETTYLNVAGSLDYLEPVGEAPVGGYAMFRVIDSTGIGVVTIRDGSVLSVDASRERVHATVHANQSTELRIAINDYPAWSATVDGHAVPIHRDADGYMLIDIPEGDAEVELRYTVTPVVWLGRALTILGVISLIVAIVYEHRRRHERVP